MENTMMKSQSAAAVNSAISNVVDSDNYFSIMKRVDGSYKSVPTTGYDVLWDNVYDTLKMNGNEAVITVTRDEFYMNVSLRRNETGTYSLMTRCKNSNEEPKFAEVVTDVKVWRGKNINIIAHAILEAIIDAYNEAVAKYYEPEDSTINEAPMVEEAPSLEEAPALDEDYTIEEVCDGFYEIVFNDEEDNDITEEGYSVAGLNYLAETMPVVPVDAIVEGVNEYFSDCYTVARNRCMGFYECDFEEFCDIVWSYVWPNVMTDEALEAETRYYMEFNDRLRYMLDNGELGALYIYNNDFVRSRFDEEAEVAA